MPEETVKLLSKEKKQYFEMALYFGVSSEALTTPTTMPETVERAFAQAL